MCSDSTDRVDPLGLLADLDRLYANRNYEVRYGTEEQRCDAVDQLDAGFARLRDWITNAQKAGNCKRCQGTGSVPEDKGSTHWEDCWRAHHDCALERIAEMERDRPRVRVAQVERVEGNGMGLWWAVLIGHLALSTHGTKHAATETAKHASEITRLPLAERDGE